MWPIYPACRSVKDVRAPCEKGSDHSRPRWRDQSRFRSLRKIGGRVDTVARRWVPSNTEEMEAAGDSALEAFVAGAERTVTGAGGTPGDAALRPLLAVPTVLLWADADEVGAAHMRRVAVRLAAMGHRDVRQVQWADAQEHDDAADALARGVDILQLVADAEPADTGIPDGAKLLDELVAYFRRYVVMSPVQTTALALWTLHTHAFGAAEVTPYMAVTSAEKRCGKTLTLEAMELVVRNSWRASRATPAALYRKIDASAPTVLMDEMDTQFKGDKEMAQAIRGILNAGYQRGGVVSVVAGQGNDMHVIDLNAFAPKALAGIGDLPDTI
ncbi:MAG: hypothetical protein IIC12_01250, partial [Proteobacteria bacterium]|nr:hypothetical protein [Pseudomonadota bacterium]